MKNDTAVFAAMYFDASAGKNVWTGLTGTRQAIRRDGYCVDPMSLSFCPHEWIDSRGMLIWNSFATRLARLQYCLTALIRCEWPVRRRVPTEFHPLTSR
jgi:hypothetical protein